MGWIFYPERRLEIATPKMTPLQGLPHSFTPSFFSIASCCPWASGGIERRIPGKNFVPRGRCLGPWELEREARGTCWPWSYCPANGCKSSAMIPGPELTDLQEKDLHRALVLPQVSFWPVDMTSEPPVLEGQTQVHSQLIVA